MKTSHFVVAAALAAGIPLLGQGPRAGQPGGGLNRPAAALNLAAVETVTGVVTAVHLTYGAQYPSITVNDMVIKLAPAWFLLDYGFQVGVGDPVTAVIAPSALPGDAYFYALEITNNTAQITVVLRDATGIPLWSRGGGATISIQQATRGGGCLPSRAVQTVTGLVESVSAGAGIQMPTLVVRTDAGALVTVKIGPERILLENDFELKAGDTVMVTFLRATCTSENVALEITNSAGVTLVLRSADGAPHWN